jgi:hypothetical protein
LEWREFHAGIELQGAVHAKMRNQRLVRLIRFAR